MATITTHDQAIAWFPKAPTGDVERAWRAAEGFIADRCRWPALASDGTPLDPPGALVEAVHLLIARLLARRNSPDGVVGVGDEFGPVRITHVDRDVMALIAPYRPVVFG